MTYETVPAAAARLGCSRRNILAMIANGRLHGCVKFGKAWQVPLEAIPDPPRMPGAKKRT
ncbi:MAG: helix-turn-helix domain-containing protein [Gallionella sp.]|nr:helix-turn-helix domain-containing protein [Gallionella sp.]